jgi:hypothetical protein
MGIAAETVAALAMAFAAGVAVGAPEDGAPDLGAAKQLKVLYAGALDSERAGSFLEFLRGSFATVGSIDIEKLSMEAAQPFDVVIADGNRLYPMDAESPLQTPKLSLDPEFTRPIVMISAVAGSIQHHTKLDWL